MKIQWYEKDPNTITEQDFNILLDDFNSKLKEFDTIYFYYIIFYYVNYCFFMNCSIFFSEFSALIKIGTFSIPVAI
jgi:hypothetical protein